MASRIALASGIFFLSFLIAACRTTTKELPLMPVSDVAKLQEEPEANGLFLSDCPSAVLADQRFDDLAVAISHSVAYYRRLPAETLFSFGDATYSASEMIASHELLFELLHSKYWYSARRELLEQLFDCYLMVGSSREKQTLFSGYFTPIIQGSRAESSDYETVAYAVPQDLKVLQLADFRGSLRGRTIVYRILDGKIVPYHSREDINQGAISKKSRVVAWLKDRINFFFFQIQGSGIVQEDSGELFQLHYAGANGRDYRSIGKLLVDRGIMELSQVSLASIKKYLRDNPESVNEILNHNSSYVFFTEKEFDGKIIGSLQQPLTYERSAALDALALPKGALLFVDTSVADCDNSGVCSDRQVPYQRFMVSQDTGGAIQGFSRIDLYFGVGKRAEAISGRLRAFGDVYFIVAKKFALHDF